MLSIVEKQQHAGDAWQGDTRVINKLWLDATENRLIPAGSTLQLVEKLHEGINKTILLDTLTGSVVTLPASVGNGAKYRCAISIVPTSNSHIVKVQNSTDVMSGVITSSVVTTGAATAWQTVAASDTVTLNRTTTGGTIKGEWLEFEDVAVGFWVVRGAIANTGSPVTPFSATV